MNSTNFLKLIKDPNNFKVTLNEVESCCVCFSNNFLISKNSPESPEVYLSLSDIEKNFFIDNIIPDNLLILSCCKIHYICVKCLRLIVNNYENHPINENNSHLSCPYPFEECLTNIGFKNVFDHNLIKKIFKTEKELQNYISHSERFSFPGYTIIKCPMFTRFDKLCNTNILVENDFIKKNAIGDVIINCDQNNLCLRKFCFHCKQYIKYYDTECYDCKTIYENENPNIFNYYLNKNPKYQNQVINYDDESDLESDLNYEESSYLFLNKEITEEIVIDQIISLLIDENTYMICAICKNSLYKTERCNGLSHHNIERCYACGRIGFISKGLIEHWSCTGIDGCFRFNHETFVKKYIPDYQCIENDCSNHEKGDCNMPEHEKGIQHMNFIKKSAYVYHILKSLLPNIRITVYDNLYNKLLNSNPELLIYLPYKQTLILLEKYKKRYRDYTEEIFYQQIKCIHPKNIPEFTKIDYINIDEYISKHNKITDTYDYNYNDTHSWQNIFNSPSSTYTTPNYTTPIYTTPTYTTPTNITPIEEVINVDIIETDITSSDEFINYIYTSPNNFGDRRGIDNFYNLPTNFEDNIDTMDNYTDTPPIITNEFDIPSVQINSNSLLIDLSDSSDLSDFE